MLSITASNLDVDTAHTFWISWSCGQKSCRWNAKNINCGFEYFSCFVLKNCLFSYLFRISYMKGRNLGRKVMKTSHFGEVYKNRGWNTTKQYQSHLRRLVYSTWSPQPLATLKLASLSSVTTAFNALINSNHAMFSTATGDITTATVTRVTTAVFRATIPFARANTAVTSDTAAAPS